jgi:hypothetical protein
MPGLDGAEATRLLKGLPNPPTVFVVSSDDIRHYREYAELGIRVISPVKRTPKRTPTELEKARLSSKGVSLIKSEKSGNLEMNLRHNCSIPTLASTPKGDTSRSRQREGVECA